MTTRILVIEDDEDFASVLRRAIDKETDLEVAQLINCEQEAIQFINSKELSNCDCVLLDLQLPYSKGDKTTNQSAGIRILQTLRQELKFYGTVIVLTNSKAPEDGQKALAAGCDGYLCKRAKISDVPEMLAELKLAIRGDVILVSTQMRHVFLRDDISAKEARLLDLLATGRSWSDIARELGYKTPKAACNIADRIFDKMIGPEDESEMASRGIKKRQKALEIWISRRAGNVTA
jgi:DNA-binding NarL/FixJ family response regulator